ncbi:MAG TPA: branched-chain amino acid ABC transporter substrate-binding protein, partial [Ottowia sp.]|nr:branched-chain amino acid ABC transporter substrate-binding protein [Ottowia sp.]
MTERFSRRTLLGATLAGLAAPAAWAQAGAGGEPIRLALIESLSGSFANTGEA